MKHIKAFRLISILMIAALVLTASFPCHSITRLPEPELAWKNVLVDGKRMAVFSLYLDSRGLMWVGTNNGLYFYDGTSTHKVGEKDLFGIQIYSIVEKDDCLLLGSNNGLIRLNLATGNTEHVSAEAPTEIRSLLLVDNSLWIGSLYGIYILDTESGNIRNVSDGLAHKSVYSLLRDSRGIVYAGTYNGLARWNPNKDTFQMVDSNTGISKSKNLFVNCLLESPDGQCIYIGSEGSLYRYFPVTDSWEKVMQLEGNNVKSIASVNTSHILIGTDNGVFDLYNNTVKHYRHDSRQDLTLSDNEIWCITSDKDNNVWAGHERGFSIASHSNLIRIIRLSALARSGEGNDIHSIHRDRNGELWLGGTNGVIRLTSDSPMPQWYRHTDEPKSLSHNRVRSIEEDSDGNLWLATDAGINKYDPQTNDFDTYHIVDSNGNHNSNWVYAIKEDGDYFWVGSFLGGIHHVNKEKLESPDGGTVTSDFALNAESNLDKGSFKLANDLVNGIVTDNDGNIWVLLFRDSHLTRYNPRNGNVSQFDIHELTDAYPSHLCSDKQGRVWCAFNGGTIAFDHDGKHTITRFPQTTGDESVLSMGQVGDNMWISTQSNVWEIDGADFSAHILPIPQKSYTAIYDDTLTNRVLLGGADEILEIDHHHLGNASEIKSIKLAIDNWKNGNLNMLHLNAAQNGLTIPYGGSISLIVSTLDYTPESVQRFMYKLAESPADTTDGWIIMSEGSNAITLSDLKMGDYEILIKSAGSPTAPTSIPLTVNPPLALSWWAVCIYIFVSATAIWTVIWYSRRRNIRMLQEEERKKALENVEKKLTFLSNISHDLKTPLSMIMGPISVMKERAGDPESKKRLETVYDNAVRLNNLIHRTLELHNLDDDDEHLMILSIFDVVEFCKDVFETFKENHPQKKFVFHSSCQQLRIEGDAVKFESVITNLLSNACKYSEEGATISCGICTQGNNVEIVVSDDGVGIAETDQPLVFQRMFRAPSTAKLKEGTGLGLYLIKKYLELMHGNIDLYSREGQGTSFIVTLPVSDKEMPHTADTQENDSGSGRQKILIVEDNTQILNFISDLLKTNYTVLSAENGRAGLAIASSFQPDLIIADEMMPILSGMEMCKRLKQNPRLASVPIIMLTAKTDNATENESIKLGIDIFMPKPFEPTVLLSRIRHLLKSRNEIKENVRIQTITEAKPIEAESATEKQLARIAQIIEDNISDPDLNVNLLCEKSDIPNKQLYRTIKKYMGVSPLDYIRRVRLQKAAMLLSQHRFTVAEISYMVGFKTPSYFAKCFQAQFGVKPSQYQSDDETGCKTSDKQ